MNNIWITSDWHFNHNKNFIWQNRGFSSIEEMNNAIIERHNKIVTHDDIVYVLGDCILGDLQTGINYIKQLNGIKYLAYGNHCTENRIKAFMTNHLFNNVEMGYRISLNKKTLILTHYPTITANGEDTRTLNLFGHTHQTTNFFKDKDGTERKYMYHVGMDSHNCTPVNLEDILLEIKKEIK